MIVFKWYFLKKHRTGGQTVGLQYEHLHWTSQLAIHKAHRLVLWLFSKWPIRLGFSKKFRSLFYCEACSIMKLPLPSIVVDRLIEWGSLMDPLWNLQNCQIVKAKFVLLQIVAVNHPYHSKTLRGKKTKDALKSYLKSIGNRPHGCISCINEFAWLPGPKLWFTISMLKFGTLNCSSYSLAKCYFFLPYAFLIPKLAG